MRPTIDELIARMPSGSSEINNIRRRVIAFRNDCGCSMSGAFLIACALSELVYFPLHGVHHVRSILIGIALIIVSALVGKLLGIGVARLRLSLLHRHVAILAKDMGMSHEGYAPAELLPSGAT
jgi:hypothetical protein